MPSLLLKIWHLLHQELNRQRTARLFRCHVKNAVNTGKAMKDMAVKNHAKLTHLAG